MITVIFKGHYIGKFSEKKQIKNRKEQLMKNLYIDATISRRHLSLICKKE